MVELTPVGKITIAVIAGLFVYFFVLPLVLNLIFPPENIERTREIRVVAFLKTFDTDSAKLQQTLRELEGEESMHGLLSLSLINVDAEPGKLDQHKISEDEIPCFILGTQKYGDLYSADWFREKILAIADVNAEQAA